MIGAGSSRARPVLRVAAWGWEQEGWSADYYPEDLPGDWRLGYYANDFRAVVVPDSLVARADEACCAEWRDDVPDEFRFVLEMGPEVARSWGDAGGFARLKARLAPLGGAVAGVLLNADIADTGWRADADGRWPLVRGEGAPGTGPACWVPGREVTQGGCLGVVPALPDALPGMRDLLEAFMDHSAGCAEAVLCVAGEPSARSLQQMQVVSDLLGG